MMEDREIHELNKKLHDELKRANRDFFMLLFITFALLVWVIVLIVK